MNRRVRRWTVKSGIFFFVVMIRMACRESRNGRIRRRIQCPGKAISAVTCGHDRQQQHAPHTVCGVC